MRKGPAALTRVPSSNIAHTRRMPVCWDQDLPSPAGPSRVGSSCPPAPNTAHSPPPVLGHCALPIREGPQHVTCGVRLFSLWVTLWRLIPPALCTCCWRRCCCGVLAAREDLSLSDGSSAEGGWVPWGITSEAAVSAVRAVRKPSYGADRTCRSAITGPGWGRPDCKEPARLLSGGPRTSHAHRQGLRELASARLLQPLPRTPRARP